MIKIATLILAGAALLAAASPQTFTGVITDTMCGKDHAHMGIKPDAKCVRECVGDGSRYKYALLVGDNVYVLSDQKAPAQFAAEKVTVTGTLYEKTKIIKVDKIERAK
jgi:hypothetical protein